MSKYPGIGTVSHATLRTQDLADSFLAVLKQFDEPKYNEIESEYPLFTDSEDESEYWQSEESSWVLNGVLFDAMNDIAAPYTYFGATEGDGSDFGFWPAIESLEEDSRYDENIQKVNDLSDIPTPTPEFIMLVNDHGNVSLYRTKFETELIWDCV